MTSSPSGANPPLDALASPSLGARPRLARFTPPEDFTPRFLEGSDVLASIARAADLLRDFDRWPTVAELDARLGPLAGVRFEEQPPKPKKRRRRAVPVGADALYDGRITLDGVVPTRARSWHDLFNALVWASFPRAKRALHARQHAAARLRIGAPRHTLPGARTPEEDALTMLDEGGELVLAGPRREVRLVFGHALLEHALAGCTAARARELRLELPDDLPEDAGAHVAQADAALADYLARGGR